MAPKLVQLQPVSVHDQWPVIEWVSWVIIPREVMFNKSILVITDISYHKIINFDFPQTKKTIKVFYQYDMDPSDFWVLLLMLFPILDLYKIVFF